MNTNFELPKGDTLLGFAKETFINTISNNVIIFDITAITKDSFYSFIQNVYNFRDRLKSKVIVPTQGLSTAYEDTINSAIRNGLVELVDFKDDNSNLLDTLLDLLKKGESIILMTYSKVLKEDISKLNEISSMLPNKSDIRVSGFGLNGTFSIDKVKQCDYYLNIPLKDIDGTPISIVSPVPNFDNLFTTNNKDIFISVFENLSQDNKDTIEMITQNFDTYFNGSKFGDSILLPKSLVYTEDGQIIGYTIHTTENLEEYYPLSYLSHCEMVSSDNGDTIFKDFPSWTRKDLIQLAHTITEKVEFFKDLDILIENFGKDNILFSNTGKVLIYGGDGWLECIQNKYINKQLASIVFFTLTQTDIPRSTKAIYELFNFSFDCNNSNLEKVISYFPEFLVEDFEDTFINENSIYDDEYNIWNNTMQRYLLKFEYIKKISPEVDFITPCYLFSDNDPTEFISNFFIDSKPNDDSIMFDADGNEEYYIQDDEEYYVQDDDNDFFNNIDDDLMFTNPDLSDNGVSNGDEEDV